MRVALDMVFLHSRTVTKTASEGKTMRLMKNGRKETCTTFDTKLALNFLKSLRKRNTAIEETGVPLAIDLRNRHRKGLISSQINENRNQIPATYMK